MKDAGTKQLLVFLSMATLDVRTENEQESSMGWHSGLSCGSRKIREPVTTG